MLHFTRVAPGLDLLLLPTPGMHLFSRLFHHRMLFSFRIIGVLNGLCVWSSACASGGLDYTPFCTDKCWLPQLSSPSIYCDASPTSSALQSTHEDRQGAEDPAEPGERIAISPLQRTLTAHMMGCWTKYEGALAHISLKRSIEMLELQCAQLDSKAHAYICRHKKEK